MVKKKYIMQDSVLKKLKKEVFEHLDVLMPRVASKVIPCFSIYDDVELFEYGTSEKNKVTIGFHVRKDSQREVHAFLVPKKSISEIEKNCEELRTGKKAIQIQYIWSFDRTAHTYKKAIRLYCDGTYFRGDLLKGDVLEVFSIITQAINNLPLTPRLVLPASS